MPGKQNVCPQVRTASLLQQPRLGLLPGVTHQKQPGPGGLHQQDQPVFVLAPGSFYRRGQHRDRHPVKRFPLACRHNPHRDLLCRTQQCTVGIGVCRFAVGPDLLHRKRPQNAVRAADVVLVRVREDQQRKFPHTKLPQPLAEHRLAVLRSGVD